MPSQKLTPFAPWCPASQCLGTCQVCPWFSNCSASTHTSRHAATRSLACPHIYVMPHQRTFSCTSTHTSCYAPAHSLALPHIHHAMLLHVLSHFRAYASCYAAVYSLALPDDVVPRCCTFSCISTHTYCYAAAQSLPLPHICHTTSQHSSLC